MQTISQTLSDEFGPNLPAVSSGRKFFLSWSHYLKLMRIEEKGKRHFYEIEATRNDWSLAEMQRQFDSGLYERLLLSRDKEGACKLAEEGQAIERPADAIKDPYVLEFLGLKEEGSCSEIELETRIIDHLQEYEKFILEYYRQDHPEIRATASHINWALDDGFSDMLPIMESDIMLTQGKRVLIIDAKCYSHATRQRFDKRSLHSANLYQIFTYVKNKEAELTGVPHEVAGMLLYAKTDEDVQPDGAYLMSGNRISVRTLDLPFDGIKAQLDAIAQEHFG